MIYFQFKQLQIIRTFKTCVHNASLTSVQQPAAILNVLKKTLLQERWSPINLMNCLIITFEKVQTQRKLMNNDRASDQSFVIKRVVPGYFSQLLVKNMLYAPRVQIQNETSLTNLTIRLTKISLKVTKMAKVAKSC